MRISLLVIATLLTIIPAAEAGEAIYYVAMDGNDANPGTFEKPWRTIANANERLQPGETVYIREGRYEGIIEPYKSGEPGRPIMYTNYEDDQVVILGEKGQPILVAIGVAISGPPGADSYIVIEGLTFSYGHEIADKRFGWVLIKGEGSQHNEIRNSTLVRQGEPIDLHAAGYREFGIIVNGASNTIIEGNTITGVYIGVHLKRAPRYTLIRGNTISRTGQSAIAVGSGDYVFMNTLIERNILERSAFADGIQFEPNYDAPDTTTDISNFGTIVRENVIRNNAENAIDLKGAAHVLIERNLIYGTIGSNDGPLDGWNRNSRATIMRGSRTSTRDVIIRNNVLYDNGNGILLYEGYKVYNNTLVSNNRDFQGSDSRIEDGRRPATWGVSWRGGGAPRFSLKNNVIIGHTVVEVSFRFRTNPTADIDYNIYRNNAFADWRDGEDWSLLEFAEWQDRLAGEPNIQGNDKHSFLSSAALFADVPEKPSGNHTSYDFNLSAGSEAIDAGGPLTWTVGSGTGSEITLEDAGYFFDGYGISGGDLIQIGGRLAKILEIDYGQSIVTIQESITWSDSTPVSLPYTGSAPDIGAYEYFEPIPLRWLSRELIQSTLSPTPEIADLLPESAPSPTPEIADLLPESEQTRPMYRVLVGLFILVIVTLGFVVGRRKVRRAE